ncbi:hypothetical protein QTN31_02795 [Alicyclobacillus cycloheptanicus]|uniref:DUF916 domain-containing protein n=2 Tax=Alicyclobacillus cycloheptanicus TaxID=1457 RepID=A0ABT9XDM0_9BACL|nr:hypothetical protein [Alicyclobacillus cycloheptanicus]
MRHIAALLRRGGWMLSAAAAAGWMFLLSGPPVLADTAPQVSQEQLFLLPDTKDKSFDIVQSLTVHNSGSTPAYVNVEVPAGAKSLAVAGKAPAAGALHGRTLTIPQAVRPNQTTVLTVSYTLPLDGQQGLQFTLHSFYPVYVAHLYLPEGNAALSAQDLFTTTSTTSIQGTTFRVFTREGIPAGDDWTLSLQMLPAVTPNNHVKGLPVLGANEDGTSNDLQALGNLFVVALVLVIGLLGIRSTQGRRRAPASRENALYEAWAQLERQYREGLVGEEDYQKHRQEFKQRLVRLKGERVQQRSPATDAGVGRRNEGV